MKIHLKLDLKQLKKQGHPLVLSIYVSKTDRIYKYSGFYSTPEMWDFKKEEPKRIHPHYVGIMDYIIKIKEGHNKLINTGRKLSAKQIVEFLLGKDDDFYHFWELRISELRQSGKNGNANFYESYLKSMKSYKKSLRFSEINYNFISKFKLDKSKTCNSGGINTYLKAMRAIYNEGVRRGVYIPTTFISPFEKVMEKQELTRNKDLTLSEMRLIVKHEDKHRFYDYFILMFLLGGLDFVDIANLRKEHIRNGRIRFERFKGGTNEVIDNRIFPEAEDILKKYECDSDFLLPVHKYSYKPYRDKFTRDFRRWIDEIGVESYFGSKSARYTFINIGKELLLNRDIIMELTGHSRNDVHSIYEGKFSNAVKDEVHRRIIDAVLE